jgi:hypothetical protein
LPFRPYFVQRTEKGADSGSVSGGLPIHEIVFKEGQLLYVVELGVVLRLQFLDRLKEPVCHGGLSA